MDKPNFSKDLSERKLAVVGHYAANLGVDPYSIHYVKTQELFTDIQTVDIAVFEPSKNFDYYIAITAGLSHFRFERDFARSELCAILPKTWKFVFDKEESYWILDLLRDIAYSMIENKRGANVGQVYLFDTQKYGSLSDYTDAVGAILTFPDMLPFEMYEVEIENTFTRYFQVVPITQTDLEKIETMGPIQFIQYELHDSEGPQTVVKLKEQPLTAIDKLVQRNEASLNDTIVKPAPVNQTVQAQPTPVQPTVQPQPTPVADVEAPVKRVRRTSAKKTTTTRRATTKRKPTTRRTTR